MWGPGKRRIRRELFPLKSWNWSDFPSSSRKSPIGSVSADVHREEHSVAFLEQLVESVMVVAVERWGRAQHLLVELSDHDTPFEQALISGEIKEELTAQVLEIVALLRSALDHAARGLLVSAGYDGTTSEVVFPVAPQGATEADFGAQLRGWLPGGSSPGSESVAALNSAQSFAGSDWLLELNAVSAAGAIELAVKRFPVTRLETPRHDGANESQLALAPKSGGGSVLLLQPASGSDGTFEAAAVVVQPAGKDVLRFLDESVKGVRGVLSRLGA